MEATRHLIIWDGDCGFCQWSVRRIMAWDRRGVLADVARQKCPTPPLTDDIRQRTDREVVVVTRDGKVLGGADAVLFLYGETRSRVLAGLLRLPPFIWIARVVYRWVANHRILVSRLLRPDTTCELPR